MANERIPVSKIVDVIVHAPKQRVHEARIKTFEELPQRYMCCEEKIALLLVLCKNQNIVLVLPDQVGNMRSICTYCRKDIGPTKVMRAVNDKQRTVIPIDQYDISEESTNGRTDTRTIS